MSRTWMLKLMHWSVSSSTKHFAICAHRSKKFSTLTSWWGSSLERRNCNSLHSCQIKQSGNSPSECQSAFKRNHSTEAALVRVHNNIAMAIDQHNSVILVLLDLLAAFDTFDHGILLLRLFNRFWNYRNCIGMVSIISFWLYTVCAG